MLKTVLISAGASLAVFVNLVLYCCLRVASDADDRMEQMIQTHEKQAAEKQEGLREK